jgi:hypothetical protein
MMEWFQGFVEEVIAEYRKLTATAPKTASWKEQLAAIRAEHVFRPTFIGSVGERLVEGILKKKKYVTAMSPGSRSPADVWAVAMEDGDVVHVSLVQVKTTQKGHAAAQLSAEDEEEFADFCLFVGGFISRSTKFPNDLKKHRILVSCAYAGVVMDWLHIGPTTYDVRPVEAASNFIEEEERPNWAERLGKFYTFV